jgi:hypothetical protein
MIGIPTDDPIWKGAECDEDEIIDGIPELTAVEFSSGEAYKAYLIALLEEYDWDVESEVWDDDKHGRIDIIAEHPAVGCVGIEVKRTRNYIRHHIAKGTGQILNYRSYTFSDYDIDYWALAPGFDRGSGPRKFKQVRNMIRRILAELKLGMVSRRREAITFGKKLNLGIPLREPESLDEADIQRIDEKIADRKWDVTEYDPRE